MPLSGRNLLREMRVGLNGCSAVPGWPESPCFWVERETCSLPRVELSHWKVQRVTEKSGQPGGGQLALAGFCSSIVHKGIFHLVCYSQLRVNHGSSYLPCQPRGHGGTRLQQSSRNTICRETPGVMKHKVSRSC